MQLDHLQQRITDRVMAHLLVESIRNKSMERGQYRAYMEDVYAYAQHSSPVIGMAGTRLVPRQPELAQYLLHHAVEELGHEKWAAADLRDLGMSDTEIQTSRPSAACLRMVGLEYFYAQHANPVGLFGWMFVLESLGGRVGGQVSRGIDEALGLQGKGVYFLSGHGEADEHHSADLTRVIGTHVKGAQDEEAFLRMADEGEDLYCAILDHAWAARTARPSNRASPVYSGDFPHGWNRV